MRRSVVLLSLLVVLTLALQAQNYTGTIRGTVTDNSNAVVPAATVTVTNAATGATRTAQTGQTGEYAFPDLPVGTYQVGIKQTGFKEFLANSVELHVSSTAVVNAQLQLGAATEQITVEANAVQVQTTSAQLGEVVNGQQVRELPLNGRSFAQLTLLQPGVAARDGLNTRDKGLLSGVDMSVNGNPVTNNLWLLDGANNNDLGSNRTILIYPSIDAIAEFNFLRNSYGPEYGQASGGVVSIVTRSGSNQFHGSVYYFGRNDALNATEYFARRAEAAAVSQGSNLVNNGKDVLRRNDYGYAIGGPIKKDKLFFFWSQEWNHEKRGNTRQACVPTLAERNGDFSTVSCGAAQPHLPGSPGTPITNLNQIPGFTGLDPAGRLLADLLPLPNATPSPANGEKNWFQSLSSPIRWRQENLRVDYHLTSKHTATFRYTQDTWSNPSPTPQPKYWGDDIFPAVEGSWSQPSKSIIGKFTSVLTSTLTNDAQFSYSNNRIDASLGGTGTQGHGASELSPPQLVAALNAAIPTVFPESIKKPGGMPPDAAWGGFGAYGDGQSLWLIAPWNNSSDLYQFRDDIAKVYNNHTFKVGVFYGYNGKNEPSEGGHDRPQFSLDSSLTGNPLADALIPGKTYGMDESSVNLFPHGRWKDIEWYWQDTWKARRNVTIEYGFRWSFLRQPYELDNKVASWDLRFYDPTKPKTDACNGLVIVPGTDPCGDANKALGTSFSSGTAGVNRALVANSNHNIAPRLGISWDVMGDGKTAVRFGIGQFYQRERVSTVTAVLGQNAPFSLSFHTDRTLDVAPALAVPSGSPSGARDPSATLPNSWQWNFSVERELARDTSLQIGYVGNRGIHLTSDFDQNAVLPQNQLLYAFTTDSSLRPAPNFGGISTFAHRGDSNYHSLQASFRTRLSNRTQIQASYTWSHTISNVDLSDSSGSGFDTHTTSTPYDPNLDRGNSEINRPHIFTANAIFYLPSLKGAHAFVQQVLGGWELATIVSAQSGNSVWVRGPRNNLNWVVPGTSLTGTIADPTGTGLGTNSGSGNSMRLIPTGVSCTSDRNGSQIFNPAAFTLVGYQLGTIEGSGRGNCLGPKLVNADISLYKNWKLTERFSMQFRFEAFNALNHPQFLTGGIGTGWLNGNIVCGTAACSPTNNVITAVVPGAGQTSFVNQSFGAATSTRGPREMQYALKFIF